MRTVMVIVLFVVPLSAAAFAQQSDMQTGMATQTPVALLSGLGSWHHPTSTKNPEAQRFFDQGFRMIYGFNHEEAVRSFKRAAELDPQMPMPWGGVARPLVPNINQAVDLARNKP